MSLSKPIKRKIADEHRSFQDTRELEYFICEVKDKIICLICNSTVSVPKLYNIKRHYDLHKAKYDQYKGLIRLEKLKEQKFSLKNQSMLTHSEQENESAVHCPN